MPEKPPARSTELLTSTERLPNTIELLFPPQSLAIPSGMTFAKLLAKSQIKTPEIKNGVVDEMNEAYVAALEQAEVTEMSQLEFSAFAPTVSSVREVIANLDSDNPWRLASPLELVLFTTAYPQYLTESPLIAVGHTAENHYPLAVTKTAEKQLQISAYLSGVTQVGARVLIVRSYELSSASEAEVATTPEIDTARLFEVMKSPLAFEVKQPQCIALVESLPPEEKIEVYAELTELLTSEDREMLAGLKNVSDLISKGAEIQKIAGDSVFDKIINEVIIARLKNIPHKTDNTESGFMYVLTVDQQKRLQTVIAILPQATKQQVWQLLVESDFLNSGVINAREKAKIIFSAVNSIFKYFENNQAQELLPVDDFNVIKKERNEINNLIGTMRNLQFV